MRIHRWCRWRWVLPALVALGLIGVVGGCTTVQNDVQARTRNALAANGLTGVTVTGSYRDVTLTGPESARAEATALARAFEAAHQVTYVGTATGATPTAGPTAPSPSVTKTPAANTLIGLMPAFASGITMGGFTLKDAALTVTGSCPGTAQLDALTAALTQAGVTSGVKFAVDPTAAAAVGHGVANPVADNATPEGRAQNRRIEFTIVGA